MEPLPIIVNGYNTLFTECSDASGSFLLIAIPPSAVKDIANLAGAMLNGHLIKMVDFAKNNDVRFIKAYY